MAKKIIQVNQIDDYIQDQCDKLIRVAVMEADSKVKQATPVDSGRLMNSWQVGENSARGGAGFGPVTKSVPPVDRMNYTLERFGQNYHIHTNLPYAEPVLTGNNLPSSWKDSWRTRDNKYQKNYIPVQVAKDIQGMIKVNARRIGLSS